MAKPNKPLTLPTLEEVAHSIQTGKRVPDEILTLTRLADAGDEAALERLRAVYTAMPSIVNSLSTLQYAVERELLSSVGPSAGETFAAQANQWRKTLAGDSPSPLERLLINRVVLDWLHALKCDLQYQQRLNDSLSIEQAAHYGKQAEQAQRRFLRSVTTLAQVRRLLIPSVQVNIGEKQINVAG